MSEEQAVIAAEREYQARLAALHEARARLNAAAAQLRRHHLDNRPYSAEKGTVPFSAADRHPSAASAASSDAELRHQIEALTTLVGQLRARAEAQRQLLHRFTDADYEPIEVAEADLDTGHFEQPPFLEAP